MTPLLSVDAEAIAERAARFMSVWSPPGDEAAMATLVHAELVAAGAEAVLDEEFPGSPSVIATVNGGAAGRTLQWHGHLDAISVPHAPVRREGDRLHGRGACDMKGAIAALIESVRMLESAALPQTGKLLVTLHGLHEEGGNAPLRRLIDRGFLGDAVVSGELGSGSGLITSAPGLSFWKIEIKGATGSVHETQAQPGAINPLLVGERILTRLLELQASLREQPQESLFVGRFASGDYFNRMPASCEIAGTRRHSSASSLSDVAAQLHALIDELRVETSADIELTVNSLGEAYVLDPESDVAQAVRRAYRAERAAEMVTTTSRAKGAGSIFTSIGVPAAYYGADYRTAHSDSESVSVEELGHLARMYFRIVSDYLGQ